MRTAANQCRTSSRVTADIDVAAARKIDVAACDLNQAAFCAGSGARGVQCATVDNGTAVSPENPGLARDTNAYPGLSDEKAVPFL